MPTSVDALKAGMSVSAPPKRPRGRPPGSKAQVKLNRYIYRKMYRFKNVL